MSAYFELDGGESKSVTCDNFIEWLKSWMPQGSPEKELHMGVMAYSAVALLANQGKHGFRIPNGFQDSKILTPYGWVKITQEQLMPPCDLIAVDNIATGLSAWRAQSFATNIQTIET